METKTSQLEAVAIATVTAVTAVTGATSAAVAVELAVVEVAQKMARIL